MAIRHYIPYVLPVTGGKHRSLHSLSKPAILKLKKAIKYFNHKTLFRQ